MPAFPFVLAWRGQPVAGFSEVSGLSSADYRADGASATRAASSPRAPEPLTLRRGVVHDPASLRRVAISPKTTRVTLQRGFTDDAAFQGWLLAAVSGGVHDTPEMLSERTRTLVVALRDGGGEEAVRFALVGCWASAVTASASGSGATDALAIESLVLQVEGVRRT